MNCNINANYYLFAADLVNGGENIGVGCSKIFLWGTIGEEKTSWLGVDDIDSPLFWCVSDLSHVCGGTGNCFWCIFPTDNVRLEFPSTKFNLQGVILWIGSSVLESENKVNCEGDFRGDWNISGSPITGDSWTSDGTSSLLKKIRTVSKQKVLRVQFHSNTYSWIQTKS